MVEALNDWRQDEILKKKLQSFQSHQDDNVDIYVDWLIDSGSGQTVKEEFLKDSIRCHLTMDV